jgi:TonB-dependent SusC/RagA subfamily outer membrane receptor
MIVVDGAILAESSVDISSQDIESVEVIKGAAAASLYGSRAASGVIQIRTVRGSQIRRGKPLHRTQRYGATDHAPINWAASTICA